MDLDALRRLVKGHVTASASTQHHMIQPVQLALSKGVSPTVEGAFRRLDAWLEVLAAYEPTTRRSYLTGMRDILRVRQVADALALDPAERASAEERLSGLIRDTSGLISASSSSSSNRAPAPAAQHQDIAALQLRVQLLENALDIIALVSRSCSLSGSA